MGKQKKKGDGRSAGVSDLKAIIVAAASGRMLEVLENVAGIDQQFLKTKSEGPCPKCGGNTRFRVVDEAMGAVMCSHCFSKGCGDFIAAIQWSKGVDFLTALSLAGKYLGVSGSEHVGQGKSSGSWLVETRPWNQLLVATWCLAKPPITPAAIALAGGTLATYGSFTVLAFPIMGPELRHDKPVGWILYNITGGTLPSKNDDGTYRDVKVKLSYGSQPGVVGHPESIRAASTLLKAEGSTDLLAWLSIGLPEGVAAFTNSNGAGQFPLKWMSDLGNSRDVLIVHDADQPGQKGAMEKWGPQMVHGANGCRNILLPYAIEPTHGKDSRDWINEGGTFAELLKLQFHAFSKSSQSVVPESVSDPHRLARINLQRYSDITDGGMLRFWNDQHFTWKPGRGCWKSIAEGELRAKLAHSIKLEYNRDYLEQVQAGKEIEHVSHVTNSLITNVIAAMNSSILMPNSVPMQTWVEDEENHLPRNLISVKNGLIDVDALLNPDATTLPDEKILLPHSPKWFSLVRLPYAFDHRARSDEWEDRLMMSFDGNVELHMVAQEWAGYSLVASTNFQKFLCMEGGGRNGKSVYMAGLSAIVGVENCSFLGLEDFGDSFAAADTIGKLLNISADCGEIEKLAEGAIKKLASGDRISVNRKGLSRVTMLPTARLVVSFNQRPRFADKSNAIWRRMILLPFKREIALSEIVYGMDKAEWWQRNGHLPGMLNWSLRGLIRLYRQGHFTACREIDGAVESYRLESNAARAFLLDHTEPCGSGDKILCSELYGHYKRWCTQNGYMPVNNNHFGYEVLRSYKTVAKGRARVGAGSDRAYCYDGLKYSCEEIAGEKVKEGGF